MHREGWAQFLSLEGEVGGCALRVQEGGCTRA